MTTDIPLAEQQSSPLGAEATKAGAGLAQADKRGVYPPLPPGMPAGDAVAGKEKPARIPLALSRADGLFFLYCIALAFFLVRWVLWAGFQGWGMAGFATLFAAGVLLYARAKKVKPPAESWYWLGVMWLCGAAFALWPAGLLQGWQALLLLGAAAYWCACLFGALIKEKTSSMLPLDIVNLALVVPFKNLDAPLDATEALHAGREQRGEGWKRAGLAALGLLLCIPLLALVLPLLQRADSGNFSRLLTDVGDFFKELSLWEWLEKEAATLTFQLIVAIPAAWYLAAQLVGAAHRRYAKNISPQRVEGRAARARTLSPLTVMMVLCVISAVYVVFIACQVPYFFSAFGGAMPGNYDTFSTYAREGFFELCRIAAINLGLALLAGCLCRAPLRHSRPLRIAGLVFGGLTLLVIATAFSKMALYMAVPNAHGLTPKRIMTCVFMLFLGGVFAAYMVFQFRPFSLVRFAALLGAGLLCALSLCNLNGLVARLNAERCQSGSLNEYNALIILRGGPAGVPAALEVYAGLDEDTHHEARQRLAYAITEVTLQAAETKGTSRDNLANARARAIKLPWDEEGWEERQRLFYEYYPPGEEDGRLDG